MDHLYGCEVPGCTERVERPVKLWRAGFGYVWRYLCPEHSSNGEQS